MQPIAQQQKFRKDINGLRCWAVVMVVLFHFHTPGFSGGFSGVDIFFVISGYLMTKILIEGASKITIRQFYLARIKRIIPALSALCIVLLLLGLVWLPASELQKISKHVIGALTFTSNFMFWSEQGYFATNAHEIWLLHTWSLSLEWQYYLILPFFVRLIYKEQNDITSFAITLVILLLISLLASYYLSTHRPNLAFYLPPTRFWELMAGGVVYAAQSDKLNKQWRLLYEATGISFILCGLFLFSPSTAWPSVYACLPVAGTALVILANNQESYFTGTKITQWFGKISYSLYLWHWPVAVLLTYAQLEKSEAACAIGLLASVLLGYISYQFIEEPARRHLFKKNQNRQFLYFSLANIFIIAVCGIIIYKHGFPGRLNTIIENYFSASDNKNPRQQECLAFDGKRVSECIYGNGQPSLLLLGDSHGDAIVNALSKSLTPNHSVISKTISACPAVSSIQANTSTLSPNCGAFIHDEIQHLEVAHLSLPLIIVNRSSAYPLGKLEKKIPIARFDTPIDTPTKEFLTNYSNQYIDTICSFSRNRKVYLVKPTPEFENDVPKFMGRSSQFGTDIRINVSMQNYRNRHAYILSVMELAKNKCHAVILDPLPYLCEKDVCWGDKNGIPLYYDDHHLSERGAELLIPMFKSITHN